MKIVVCIKQVPDTTSGVVKVDELGVLRRDLMPTIINHDDKTAIEAALQLREKLGGTVTIVTMGPPQADIAMREALAMGADEAVILGGREFAGSDTYATSGILAGAIKNMDYDVIITGRQAIDGDTAQVGPQLGEKLGLPQVTYVEEIIEATEEYLVVKRQFEDGYHIIKIKTPCLLTAIQELAEPRYMTVSGVWEAYKKEVKTIGFEDIKDSLEVEWIGLKGSPTNIYESFTKELKGAGTVLKDLSPEKFVEAIVEKLDEKHII